ncbi:hypothetical protein IWW36_004356 [Coemansia brasiliensis]|uniref:pyridoxal 5'-phosphate synthase (glutamine hydrolyzing) n=1 Tax=Coemansia brasiliensis TaxID=2650707 RepID=A0A9W8IAX4_9FUNG|nr:hypothetical protein IWW36_004356 [Coemansia brasiliensis]
MPEPSKEQKHITTMRNMTDQFKNGVIVSVETSDHAVLAEKVGALGVEAVANVEAFKKDIAKDIPLIADPATVRDILNSIVLPVIARVRQGHFIEAEVMEASGADAIDEHEVDSKNTDVGIAMDKKNFKIPVFAGAANLKEALTAINQGASLIRTTYNGKYDAPNIDKTVQALNKIVSEINDLAEGKITVASLGSDLEDLAKGVAKNKKLPVPLFADGGIVLPSDAAMMMELGADGVIVSSLVFYVPNPDRRIWSIIKAVTHYNDPSKLIKYVEY